MNSEERSEFAKYKMEAAYKTFDAALVLAERGFWNSAVNRLYYSLFYAVNALLVIIRLKQNLIQDPALNFLISS